VGRRPLAGEVPTEVALVVDLTAEFPEPRAVRLACEYVAAPMLDTGIPVQGEFERLVHRIAEFPKPVYIHCAQGHGRAGTLAAAVLIAKGLCATVEEAVSRLRAARPGLGIGDNQRAFLERVCRPDRRDERAER